MTQPPGIGSVANKGSRRERNPVAAPFGDPDPPTSPATPAGGAAPAAGVRAGTSARTPAQAMARAAMMAAVTAVLAQVTVPLPGNPVPVTLQVLGVLLAGLLLPPLQALESQAVYVALGAVGLPVFAGARAGFHVLVGPTGGYLWGFILGAYVTARLRSPAAGTSGHPAAGGAQAHPWPFVRDLAAAVAGVVCVYAVGVLQLGAVANLPPGRALMVGAVPFVPWDLAKAAVAAALAAPLRRALGRSGLAA